MKRIVSVLTAALILICSFVPAAADDLFFNTLNGQQYITDTVNFAQYTVGYTIASSCGNDWGLQPMPVEGGEYYTATVTAGSTLSFQLNCPGGGEDVNLGIMLGAANEAGEKIGSFEAGNSEDRSEMVSGEYLVPDDAKTVEIIMLAIPHKLNLEDVSGAGVGMIIAVEGKEEAPAAVPAPPEVPENSGSTKDEKEDGESSLELITDDKSDEAGSVDEAFTELAKGALKAAIPVGAAGLAILAGIIALIRKGIKRKAVKAAKAVSKGAGKSAGKAAEAGTGETASNYGGSAGGVGDSYVVTDPATGAQTLYVRDADGNWVSSDGGSVLDTGRVSEWQQQRTSDRAWQDQSNEAMKKPTTFEDIDRQAALEEERIARESYIDQVAVKHGVYGEDIDTIYEKVSHDQARAEVFAEDWQKIAEHADTAVEIAENLKTTADYSVSALGAVTGPAGTVVKDIYAAGTTVGGDVSEAIAAGKDAWDVAQAASAAVAKSAVGVIQNHAAGAMGKASADILGGAATGGLDAYVKGESVGQGIAKGTASGMMNAAIDTGGEMAGALRDGSSLAKDAKDFVSSVSDTAGDLMKNNTSDAINESFDKTFKELNHGK